MSIKSWLGNWLLETRKATSLSLDEAVGHYQDTLSALEEEANTAAFLSVLLQRDQVAVTVKEEKATPTMVQRLAGLDHRLRHIAPRIPVADWNTWRRALNPPPERWWWRLDETQTQAVERSDLPWIILSGILMTVTFGLAVEVVRRVWSGGPDPLSVISAVLTFALSSSPLSKQGRELAGWLMDKVRLPTHYRGETMLGTACLAFVAVLALRLALPALAIVCNNRGYTLLQAGDLTGSQQAFARAVSINPDYAAGYYNLADAYVEVGDYDRARSLYQQALTADRTLDLAYNGLGYVLILQGKPEQAIPVLYTGLSLAQDGAAQAALWTNLGRAYLESGRYDEAEEALSQALVLRPEEAAAHCTLALTAGAMEHPKDEVTMYWENCLRYADPIMPRGQELVALARAHLRQLEGEK